MGGAPRSGKASSSSSTLQFLGGVGTVTGSKALLRIGGKNILVDCGLFQGYKHLRLKNRKPLPIRPTEIDAVILTHAHIDHTGYVPVLVKNGFRGRVYCSPPTADLLGVLLPDAGYLQEEEARFANKEGFSKHHPALPLFSRKDAEDALRQLQPVPFGKVLTVQGLKVEFLRVGHILGAAMVRLTAPNGTSLVFSGDLGRPEDPLMPAPGPLPRADILILESTYGHRDHPATDASRMLADVVNRTIRRGGTLVIPSFTVGRAQTLLYLLHELKRSREIPDVPVFLNSPMAVAANRVFLRHAAELRIGEAGRRKIGKVATAVATAEASKELNRNMEPKIIIAGNGMATGGRVIHHLKTFLPGKQNTVLLVGYQAGGTRGASLVQGAREVKIHREMVPVRAKVVQIEALSAHADRGEILSWLQSAETPPRRIFINHGEPDAADSLRRSIEAAFPSTVVVPDMYEEFSLEK